MQKLWPTLTASLDKQTPETFRCVGWLALLNHKDSDVNEGWWTASKAECACQICVYFYVCISVSSCIHQWALNQFSHDTAVLCSVILSPENACTIVFVCYLSMEMYVRSLQRDSEVCERL